MIPRWAVVVSALGAAGVVAYVTAWAVAGVLTPGYDPRRQAISELFALEAPTGPRLLLIAALVVTGVLLVAMGPALHRGLPGEGLAGPVLTSLSGIGTVAVALAPCSDGCPGFGTSLTDSLHTLTAAFGYLTLIAAPLAFAVRLRPHLPWFAAVSAVLGGVASIGFVLRYGGVVPSMPGLQQRILNTTADVWYVIAALVVVERARTRRPEGRAHR